MKNKQHKYWSNKKSSNCVCLGSIIKVLLLSLLLPIFGCANLTNISPEDSREITDKIALDNAVFEQANSDGATLWRVKADRVVYSPDRQIAYLDRVVINLLKDKQITVRIKAEKAEIHKNGAQIYLKERILAVDTRNNIAVRSELARWYPPEKLLILEQNLRGTRDNIKVWAKLARYYTDRQHLELVGEIIAEMSEPTLKMEAEYFYWQIPQQKAHAAISPENNINNSRPEIYRYHQGKISQQVSADRIEADIAKNSATFIKNARWQQLEPAIEIVSDTATWYYQKDLVTTEKPIRIVDRAAEITVTGNRGQIDLKQKIANLTGGVRGINNRDRSELFVEQLNWQITPGIFQGTGNVSYQQNEPKLAVTGTKAVGKLANNEIIVTGTKKAPTVTKIYP